MADVCAVIPRGFARRTTIADFTREHVTYLCLPVFLICVVFILRRIRKRKNYW